MTNYDDDSTDHVASLFDSSVSYVAASLLRRALGHWLRVVLLAVPGPSGDLGAPAPKAKDLPRVSSVQNLLGFTLCECPQRISRSGAEPIAILTSEQCTNHHDQSTSHRSVMRHAARGR